ncbi:MAG: RHS repeat protein, partial [Coriobacteriia bacterium]|nr:RHS repeat protein [Coriobacteriia bacterium]
MRSFVRARSARFVSSLLAFTLATTPVLGAFASTAHAEDAADGAVAASPDGLPPGAVEDVSLRTRNAKQYRLPDGRIAAVISEAPVHYRDTSGAWVEIDTTLVGDSATGRVRTKSAPAVCSFGADSASSQPVRVSASGRSVGLNMLGVAEGRPLALGSHACYAGVAADASLVYEAQDDGMKQTIVLSSPKAASSYRFYLDAGGLSLREDGSGGWVLVEPETGAPVFGIGGLCVFDSSRNAAGDPAYCPDATMTVEPVSGGAYVTYSVPSRWLADPSRRFPVMIDPSLTAVSALDTYVASAYPATNYNSSTELKCGYYDSTTGHNRTLVKFDLSAIPSIARVDSATFSIYQFHTYYTNTATTTYLAKATSSWGTATTWNTKPSYSYLASQSIAGRGVWVNWSQTAVKTTVQGWVANSSSNYGFMCYQKEDGSENTTHWRKFYSREYSDSALRPKLVVTYTVIPDPVSDVSACTHEAYEWFREVDRNGDGVSDTPDDLPLAGRGGVKLSWPAAPRAEGYNIYQWDGDSYEKVGTTLGSNATTWTSQGCGIYPTDSEIAGWSAAARNALTRAASPRAMSQVATVAVEGQGGAGLVVTDGTYLFVRRWGNYPGSAAWKRIGTGFHGTVAGKDYGTVGPDLSAQSSYSAFYLDGFLFSGAAVAKNAIRGIWKDAPAGEDRSREIAFSAPLLDRDTGAELTGASSDVLVTTDGNYIYNVAYGIGGSTYNGYTIRVFGTDGVKRGADRTIAVPSEYIDGVLCDGSALYLIQWANTDSAHVTKIRLSDFRIANQWPINQATTRVINGCYDPANGCFWLGSLDCGEVRRYLGAGLDLRDDPRPLYRKGANSTYYDSTNYWFRIVPFNDYGQPDILSCAAYTPTLDNRTVRVADQARHTTAELPDVASMDASVELDRGALRLEATDLEIASWGPAARVARSYCSSSTAPSLLHGAPGWRFSFERALEITSTSVTYVDETGQRDRFVLAGGAYHAPNGSYARLATETVDGALRYRLIQRDRSSSVFDASGRLLADYDQARNAVTYERSAGTLVITAANGQRIVVLFDADGHVQSATYSTAAGTRRVEYADRGGGVVAVTAYAGSDAARTTVLAHSSGRLAQASIESSVPGDVIALWSVIYGGDGRLACLRLPGYASDSLRRVDVTYSGASATVTRFGTVEGTPGTAVLQAYTWNPTGTTASKTDPYTQGAAPATWTYAYNASNEAVQELSPTGAKVSRTVDGRGNVTEEVDEEGHRTVYVYDALDRCVREVDPRGCTTYRTYASTGFEGAGPLEAEEKQLDGTARSRVEYSYNASGTVTLERQRLNASEWAVTEYSDFAPCGQAQTTTRKSVRLSPGGEPIDLIEHTFYDAFGNVVSRTDACGVVTERNTYDIAGRVLETKDATGTVTHHEYDLLGNETLSWRQARDGSWCDRTAKTYDAEGRVLTETRYLADTAGQPSAAATVTHSYDQMGREISSDDSKVADYALTRYDARGNATVTWPEGSDTSSLTAAARTEYDAYGRVCRELAPGAETSATVTTYYPNSLVKRVTNPDGSWTEHAYDQAGNTVKETKPTEDGRTTDTTFGYDVGGRKISETSSDGATTTFGYDLAGRQVSAASEGATPTVSVYNTVGWKLSETDPDGVVKTWTYDACGRVLEEAVGGKASTTAYDALGNAVFTRQADGTVARYVHDAFGRVVQETQESSSGAVLKRTSRAYDAMSRTVETTVTDMVSGAVRWSRTTYPESGSPTTTMTVSYAGVSVEVTYDGAGREASRVASTPAGVLSLSFGGFDAAGRPCTIDAGSAGSKTRAFDQAGRLSSESGYGYASDPAVPGAELSYNGNTGRLEAEAYRFAFGGRTDSVRSYAYTADGRLASASISGMPDAAYAYEPGTGNLIGIKRGSEPTTTLAYEQGSGRIAALLSQGATQTVFSFDSRGRRASQGTPASPQTVRFFYDDADRLVGCSDASRGVSASYAYDAYGQRLRSVVASGSLVATTAYAYDGLSLLRATTARSDGTTESVTYLY